MTNWLWHFLFLVPTLTPECKVSFLSIVGLYFTTMVHKRQLEFRNENELIPDYTKYDARHLHNKMGF